MYAYVPRRSRSPPPTCRTICRPSARSCRPASRRRQAEADKPKQVNKAALAKKIKAQLDGIDVLEQAHARPGPTRHRQHERQARREMEEQAKQLGNAYLPGSPGRLAQLHQALRRRRRQIRRTSQPPRASASTARRSTSSAGCTSLVKQGRAYLQRRLDDPELKPETDSGIAAWLGHAWQLRELKDAGLVETDAELVQLAFNSHDDVARQEYVDTGVWMTLGNGRIRLTQNFRPYKAVKYHQERRQLLPGGPGQGAVRLPRRRQPAYSLGGDVAAAAGTEGPGKDPRLRTGRFRRRRQGSQDARSRAPLADKQPIFALNFTPARPDRRYATWPRTRRAIGWCSPTPA